MAEEGPPSPHPPRSFCCHPCLVWRGPGSCIPPVCALCSFWATVSFTQPFSALLHEHTGRWPEWGRCRLPFPALAVAAVAGLSPDLCPGEALKLRIVQPGFPGATGERHLCQAPSCRALLWLLAVVSSPPGLRSRGTSWMTVLRGRPLSSRWFEGKQRVSCPQGLPPCRGGSWPAAGKSRPGGDGPWLTAQAGAAGGRCWGQAGGTSQAGK